MRSTRVATASSADPFPEPGGAPAPVHLPFTVRVAATEYDLRRVQQLRQTAYGHHLPDKAEEFGQPEAIDRHPDVLVILAECKQTGVVLGSARVQVNRSTPLQIERSIVLPSRLQGRLLSEITRLTVAPAAANPLIRLALVKACHLLNVAFQVYGTVAGARHSLLRQYHALGFQDLFDGAAEIPLAHACGLPHRVLFLATNSGDAVWRNANQAAYRFVMETWHPDIDVFSPVRAQGIQALGAARAHAA